MLVFDLLDLDRYAEDTNAGFYSTEVSARFDTIDVGIPVRHSSNKERIFKGIGCFWN